MSSPIHIHLDFLTRSVPAYQGADGCLVLAPGQYLNFQKGHRISLILSFPGNKYTL